MIHGVKLDMGMAKHFATFDAARDWAANHVKGYPAWRVMPCICGMFIVSLNPEQHLYYSMADLAT